MPYSLSCTELEKVDHSWRLCFLLGIKVEPFYIEVIFICSNIIHEKRQPFRGYPFKAGQSKSIAFRTALKEGTVCRLNDFLQKIFF